MYTSQNRTIAELGPISFSPMGCMFTKQTNITCTGAIYVVAAVINGKANFEGAPYEHMRMSKSMLTFRITYYVGDGMKTTYTL